MDRDDWVGPFWLERQRDPRGPDFVPGEAAENVTHRTWTRLGVLSGVDRAVVDPRGLVTNADARWSLDWWIGADDRWHLPSREVAVRQNLVGDAPVVETAMRVPGGDAVHRAYVVAGPDQPLVVVEVENRTAIPFAVAFALRPYHPLGDGEIGRVALDGSTVLVDGVPALLLPKTPARAAASTAEQGDVVHVVTGGDATADLPEREVCPRRRAQAAFVFPLPHTAVLRVALPMTTRALRGSGSAAIRLPEPVPTVEQVVSGWDTQARRRLRVDVPDQRLSSTLEAARRHLLLLAGGEEVAEWPSRAVTWRETATVTMALDAFGFHDEAARVVATLPDRQGLDGYAGDGDDGWAANGAALLAVGSHWMVTRDDDLVEALVGPVAKAAHWIGRHGSGRRARRRGLVPTAIDLAWSIRGMRAAAAAMAGVGQPEVAEDLLAFADGLVPELRAFAPRLPADLEAAGIGALDPDDEWVRRVVAGSVATCEIGDAVFDAGTRLGLHPRLTLLLADVERRSGDRRTLDRLAWLVEHGSPTATWPSVVHPRSGGGSAGDGHDAATTAAFCSGVRDLLVDDSGRDLVLSSVVPAGWRGQGWEVHDAPTAFGRLGYAVRWHGDRPALLWELEPHVGAAPVTVRAPGLDATWSSDEPSGEALLAPVPTDTPESGPSARGPGASSTSFG